MSSEWLRDTKTQEAYGPREVMWSKDSLGILQSFVPRSGIQFAENQKQAVRIQFNPANGF